MVNPNTTTDYETTLNATRKAEAEYFAYVGGFSEAHLDGEQLFHAQQLRRAWFDHVDRLRELRQTINHPHLQEA